MTVALTCGHGKRERAFDCLGTRGAQSVSVRRFGSFGAP